MLRTLRVLSIEGEAKISSFNVFFMSSVLLLSVILSIPQIRGILFKLLFYLYYYTTLSIAYAAAFLIFSFAKIFTLIFGKVDFKFNLDNLPQIKNSSNEFAKISPNEKTLIDVFMNSPIVNLLIKIVLFLILIKIVMSILKRIQIGNSYDEEFVEHKESIKVL
ncbi:hypothetical protein PL321_18785 [Caloramator sp. mosi_1]|uniref:hypothetical protein n=1 Tax=Caloramator sp. mosi_1 TaxID=3023090 RepID=UPI00236174DD|nr:hypothetical protein [Caloramator sp. mosi_1]WDC84239.1 hypothetical protein PL321_18785 [Caloramator sp. mosi_1]